MRFFNLPVVASYKYRWPQLSRSENQMNSFDAGRYFQFTRPLPDSKNVSTFSSNTSRTSPVVASAVSICSCRWPREVDTNARWVESLLHWTSDHSPPRQAM